MTTTGQHSLRVPVEDAAKLLDITIEAVRKRIERGTLRSEKVGKARYVILDTDMIRHDDVQSAGPEDHDTDMTQLVAHLEEQAAFLREVIRSRDHELRRREEEYQEETHRKDTIIMSLIQRVPELEAPSEPREGPESASEASGKGEGVPSEERRPWWRRMFSP